MSDSPTATPAHEPLPPALSQMLDRQAIHDVLMRYARGIDRCDFELVRGCYHPGARDDHGGFKGSVEEFIPWVQTQLDRFDSTMHFLGNVLIEFDPSDPNTAAAETYCVAYHRLTNDEGANPQDSIAGLRYLDRFERRQAVDNQAGAPEWRIVDRKIVVEWNRLDDVNSLGFSPAYLQGKRDRTDPVYQT